VDQERVRHAAPQHVAREPIAEPRPIPDMVKVWLPVARYIEAAVRLDAREQALIVIPIRCINGYRAVAVIMPGEKGAQAVANLARRPLPERGETEKLPESRVAAQHVFIA
jgi:hypothetical protein